MGKPKLITDMNLSEALEFYASYKQAYPENPPKNIREYMQRIKAQIDSLKLTEPPDGE